MKRQKQAHIASAKIKEYLIKNPEIKEALRIFDISYEQYQKALDSGYRFYNDTSTSPSKIMKLKS